MNNKELCKILNISEPTLYNWKKEKPVLYKIVIEYKESKENNKNLNILDELIKYFNNLKKIEQEYYLAEIKAKILKREIEEKRNEDI